MYRLLHFKGPLFVVCKVSAALQCNLSKMTDDAPAKVASDDIAFHDLPRTASFPTKNSITS